MTSKLSILLSVSAVVSLSSCKVITTMKRMDAKTATYSDYSCDGKTYRFVEMVHVAKPALYESVAKTVETAKNDGYVLFYEFVDFKQASDEEKHKVKEMVGFVPSPEGYAIVLKKLLKQGYVVQDNSNFLGKVNNLDFNVDISPTELINAYETKFGKIVVTQKNLGKPIDEKIQPSVSKDKSFSIILGYRNTHLAKAINDSAYKKIIVLYGADHRDGLLTELKKINSCWGKKE